ncbi:MAG: PD40 domain-containing protein [Deltaproteobacteria bacterium]|nr:PD40 domain-containing protein [Deltaproteobacteria bacterium]
MLKKISFILFFVFIFISQAHARIYILIDELSEEKKFPIAVPSFLTEKGGFAGGTAKKMNDLIRKDLKIAGFFNVIDDSLLPNKDSDVEQINFEKWQALEVGALVKGIVTKPEKGGKTIQLKLYHIGEKKMILGKQYTVDNENYIDAVHRFVDDMMEVLTGVAGPFDSKVVASCGKPFKRRIGTFDIDSSRRGGVVKAGINDISPAWAPNGKQIAYTSFTSRYPEIYISGRKITNFKSTTITPAWTPDGSKLIVASAFTGDTELYLISQSGRVLRQITKSPNIDLDPAVSADGRLLFASERAGGLQIFLTSLDGGGVSQVTYTGYQNLQPDWSPDGSKITFCGKDQGAFDIFVMEADGSNILRLTRGEGNNESPVWAPDSRYIAFYSSRGGIFVMLDDGTNQTLIEKSESCINLDWGPRLTEKN